MGKVMRSVGFSLVAATLLVGAMAVADSAPPRLIPFQGRMTDGTGVPLPDNVYKLTFAVYDAHRPAARRAGARCTRRQA